MHNSALVLLAQGRGEEALAEVLREPEEWARLCGIGGHPHAAGRREESEASLEALIAKYQVEGTSQVAEVYAARGEVDNAFDWLERAYVQRDPGLSRDEARTMIPLAARDPRWDAFLRKMGLAD